MIKIDGLFYQHENKANLDLSNVKIFRFNLNENQHINISFRHGKVDVYGSGPIKIQPSGGCNNVKIDIDNE